MKFMVEGYCSLWIKVKSGEKTPKTAIHAMIYIVKG